MNVFKISFVACALTVVASGQQLVSGLAFESGSLPLKANTNFKLSVSSAELTFIQGKQAISIPLVSLGNIIHGQNVRGRGTGTTTAIVAASVVVAPAALLLMRKKKKHYIGLTWKDTGSGTEGGVMFRVAGEKQKRDLLSLLQRTTGKEVIDTDQVLRGR